MTSGLAFRRFVLAFGASFPVFYVIALARDVALFTVYPSLGIVLFGTRHSLDVADPAVGFLALAIYWYGWTATAATGALIIGLLAVSLPDRSTRFFGRAWICATPVLAIVACVYLALPFFRL